MMTAISNLWPTFLKSQDFNKIEELGILVRGQNSPLKENDLDFFVSWGDAPYGVRGCVVETGFFQNCIHLDSNGLYEQASFNFPEARKIITDFEAPKSWNVLKQEGKLKSKYGQPPSTQKWDGVVIICQYPKDRSVLRSGSTKDYHDFIVQMCKFYGKDAFLKYHPVTLGNKEEISFLENTALKYGCEVGYVGSSILEKAESVIVYNSTYVVDALMAGKHVFQYAPGYFWQSGVVQYLNRTNPSRRQNTDQEYVDKFIDFLIWKYCFSVNLPLDKIAEIIKCFERSNEFFPLPQELSYGHFINS